MKSSGVLPRHVAVIMDGNGRWARKRALPRKVGHRAGVKTMLSIVRHAFETGIEYVTVYAFSTENRFRPKDEVDSLMALIRRNFATTFRELVDGGIRVIILGERSYFPADIEELIGKLERDSAAGTKGTLMVALNYGSRDELVRAVNAAVKGGITVDEEKLSGLLYTAGAPDPDLIIRTGGEKRLSNFLLYQAAYSELFFTDTLWPDFSPAEFDGIIEEFSHRTRRFGKV